MKRFFILFFSFLLIFGCSNKKKENNVIKIGVILPLSGDAAIYGQAMKNGLLLAYEESNIKGTIELIIDDDMGSNLKASNSAQFLLSKKVDAVIGGAQSKTADVIIPTFSENKIPIVSPGASSVDFDSISDYFFRLWPSDSYDGKIMAEVISKEIGDSSIAVFYTNSKYGVGIKNVFEDNIKTTNKKIVFSEPFSEGEKDFRTQLQKIKNSGAKVMFLPGYYSEVYIIIKQIREIGLNIKIFGTSSFHDNKLIEALGDSLNGIVFSYPDFDIEGNNKNIKTFSNKYFNKYKSKADVFAANTYDCFKVIEYALLKGAKNSQEIQIKMHDIKNFDGASGNFSFDKMGSVIKIFNIYTIEHGEFKLLKKN